MSKGQTFKVLVNERLTAAAEEIFAIFEKAIAEYEEELCRFRENQMYHLKYTAVSPKVQLLHSDSVSSDSGPNHGGLNQCIASQTSLVTWDPVKEEEEQRAVASSQYSVSIKTEEDPPVQRKRPTEHGGTQGEDNITPLYFPLETTEYSSGTDQYCVYVKTEKEPLLQMPKPSEEREGTLEKITITHPYFPSETTEKRTEYSSDTDNVDDWLPPVSCSAAQLRKEEKEGPYIQVIRNRSTVAYNSSLSYMSKSAPETSMSVNKPKE
ncbi:hypothetical protein WMY93_000794 [Mugilogobius chulae]|uniref:Uncharacterized protein n=1 Tax=Mugilogobius chulae TaxID=88201 RepID=A0AAW0Q0C2_9GOBI